MHCPYRVHALRGYTYFPLIYLHMKIGIVGTIWYNIPPQKYGGTEDVIYNLTNGLAQKDHEVVLFGPATAQVEARVIPTVDIPLRDKGISWSDSSYAFFHLQTAFEQASKFDILHVHLNREQDFFAFPLARFSKTPVLFTLHFRIPEPGEPERGMRYFMMQKYRDMPFASISDNQRKPLNLNYIRTVYNGIDLQRFPFSERKGTYLAWLGKITPFKGTKEAIIAAKKAGIKIFIMGSIETGVAEHLAYFQKEIKPLFNDRDVVWLGEVSHVEKTSILSGAIALLNPIKWDEPFGLVMAEAQAVGTPVIAFRQGAAPEVIQDGKTGFLVDTVEQMSKKIKDIGSLKRQECRRWVEQKFSIDTMVEGYEGAYKDAIAYWDSYKKRQQRLVSFT